jgi:cytochrome P450
VSDVVDGRIAYDPYDYELDADPYPVWKRMRDEAPVYYNEPYDFYALTRFDDIKAASNDWQTFSSARGSVLEMIRNPEYLKAARAMLFMDPPDHTSHRALAKRVFTPRRVSELEPRVRELTAGYLDRFVGSGGFDYVADFGALLPMMVIGSFLGVPVEDQDAIRELTDVALHREEGQTDPDLTGLMLLAQYFDAACAIRRFKPRDDFITALVQSQITLEDGTSVPFEGHDLLRFISLLATAGNETVARLMGWAAVTLANNPDQRQLLVDDPSLIPNAVEELLRYEAPSPVQARYITRDVELHGVTIPEGAAALLVTGAAGRDERAWPDPDTFDVRRKIDPHHVSFGFGIHFCLGAALARLEARVALEETLKRFPRWDIDWDRATRVRTSTVRGYERLPIVL